MKKFLQIVIILVSIFVLISCGEKTPDLTIDAPTNVEINGDILTWSAVSGADSYLVNIDTRSVEVEGTTFNLANEPMTIGEHVISVSAVKGDGFSIPSAVLTYVVASLADPANIALAIIEEFNPTYEIGMDQTDFTTSWEYDSYLTALEIAQAYADATANVRMTEANAIGFFGDFMSMAQSNEITTLDGMMDEMEMFETYNMTPYATAYVLYNVAIVGMDEGMDQEIFDAYTDNEELIVQSLEVVLDFLMTVKNAIPANVITTIDDSISGNEITNSEIFLIKDEMISILIDNLPSIADFTILYTTLFHVVGTITGEDMTSYVSHASYLAEVNHLELDLILSMLDAITLAMVDDIEVLIDEMNIEVYNPLWDDYYTETDPKKAVELILYIATFIDDFKTTNSVKFDELDTLMQDDSAEALFGIAIDNVISQIQSDTNISADQKVEIVGMLNDFKGEYDTIVSALNIIKEIGLDVFEEFVDTEASLIMNILTLNESEDLTPSQITTLVTDIIDDAISLNGVVMDKLDQAAFQTLLDFMKLPMTLQFPMLFMMMDMGDVDYEAIYDTLSPFIAELLANAVVLEKAVVTALDTLDVSSLFESDLGSVGMILSPLLDVLNTALTPANEALIMDSIDIIFDDILKHTDILELQDMTINEVDEMKVMVIEQVEFLIDEIQTISTWDLENLTLEQQDRVDALLMIFNELFNSNSNNSMFDDSTPVFLDDNDMFYMNENGEMFFEFIPETTDEFRILCLFSYDGYSPDLIIFDSQGNEITYTYFQESMGKLYFSNTTIQLDEGQSYYIGIFGDSFLPFTLEIKSATVNYPSIFDSSKPVLLNNTYIVNLNMLYAFEVFSFTPAIDGNYDIYSSSYFSNDPYMILYNEDLINLGIFDDEASNNNFYADNIFLQGGQTYYILISSFADYLSEFQFDIIPGDEGEPDPVASPFDDAILVTAGQTVTVTVMPNETIYYMFQPIVSGFYDIYSTVPDGSVDPILYIYASPEDYLGFGDDEGENWNFYIDDFYFSAGQTYYFLVETYNLTTKTFTFIISNPN